MSNYPYIGDHPAEPPEDDYCENCYDTGVVADLQSLRNIPCPHCQPSEDYDYD